MANLPESSTFDAGVYQIETTDPVIGGPSGVTNNPLKNLTNRTKYLKDHVDALESGATPAGAATKLAAARNIALSGDVSGQASFDGTASATIAASVVQASTSKAGKVQLATAAEALAATNASKAVTPAGLANYINTSQVNFTGQVAFFAMQSAPTGWLKCNGAAVSRTTYAALFAAIGITYGAGNGVDTFNLPDLRGEFIRALDEGRGVDGGRTIGSWQGDELRSHAHVVPVHFDRSSGVMGNLVYGDEPSYGSGGITSNSTGGAETRPRNVAMLACIKF